MATAYSGLGDTSRTQMIASNSVDERNRRTIQGMVDGFAKQDIDGIMALMADEAVYCDILGKGRRGDEYRGKDAIRTAFARQFELAGTHSYSEAKIMVDGDLAFASWTMVIGDPADLLAPRFEGIDEFLLNSAGQIVLKKAWLKGQPRLRRSLMLRNPTAVFRHFRYSLRSLGWGE
jgi:ketosteroid isomerase-like protein